MVPRFGVSAECQSIGTSGGLTKAWCPGLVSRPSAKAQKPLARSRGQWQEVEGLLFSPKNSQLVHILSFHSQGVVSFFIFPTGQIALDSEPRGRRCIKNKGHNRNRLYSRAIHCPASMEKHYVQWFLLKSVYDITVCEKKLDFAFWSLRGPSHGARVWCLGRVPKYRNQWQEVEGLLFSPQNSQLVHILSFHSQAVVSLFIFLIGPTALDSEPHGRRYVKNMIYNRNHLYSRAIH